MQRILMFDGGNVEIFSSPENLCAHIEYPSFSGDEEAYSEEGEIVRLFIDKGASIKSIFGKDKFIDDFKFVNFEMTGDFSLKEELASKLHWYLTTNGMSHKENATLDELFDLTRSVVGISF